MSVGQGVCLDVANKRLSMYSDSHADAQYGGDDFYYSWAKIWATMGRNDVNGVLRYGFVEEGDPVTPLGACGIREFTGVYGPEAWDTVNAYAICQNVPGNQTWIGCLAPFHGIWVHIDLATKAVTQPQVEYWYAGTSGVQQFTPATPIDFTCANGRSIQPLVFNTNAWTWGLVTAAGEERYWIYVKLVGNAPAVPVMGNKNYKDFLTGYIRHFYTHWDVKRGDDSTGGLPTKFVDEGDFVVRFRPERKWDTRTTLIDDIQFGKRYTTPRRQAVGRPWAIVQKAHGTLNSFPGIKAYGGMFMMQPKTDGDTSGIGSIQLRASGPNNGHLIGCSLSGYAGGLSVPQLGISGVGSLKIVDDLRLTKDSKSVRAVGTSSFDETQTDSYVTRFVIDQQEAVSEAAGMRTSSPNAIIREPQFSSDAQTGGQFDFAGSGIAKVIKPRWGGPNNKFAGLPAIEFWMMTFRLFLPDYSPAVGFPLQLQDSIGQWQIGDPVTGAISDSNGRIFFPSVLFLTGADAYMNLLAVGKAISGVFTDWDAPFTITVNGVGVAGYDPAYQTTIVKTPQPREWFFDGSTRTWYEADWQRRDAEIPIVLSLTPPPSAPPVVFVDQVSVEADEVERSVVAMPSTI